MANDNILTALEPKDFGYTQAAHLLNRCGFGGSPDQILELQAMGLDQAVQYVIEGQRLATEKIDAPLFKSDILQPTTNQESNRQTKAPQDQDTQSIEKMELEQQRRQAQDQFQMHDVEKWWLERMINTPWPLQEKMTLLWHSQFPARYIDVRNSFMMWQQNQLFRQHAAGSFADLLQGVVHDPATIRSLNNDLSLKKHSNEEMARAVLEQFALGEGQFTENDVRESARALTGYTCQGNSFFFNRLEHDGGTKSILGQRGNIDGDKLVDLLLDSPACRLHVGRALYSYFVSDLDATVKPEGADAFIASLAQQLAINRYQMTPVLVSLFRSKHFYSPAVIGNKIKSPAHLLVTTAKLFKTPQRDSQKLFQLVELAGQRLFAPPGLGWPSGRGWINPSTLYARHNLCAYLITGKLMTEAAWTDQELHYDPMFLLEPLSAQNPEAVVDFLLAALVSCPVRFHRRRCLVDFLSQRRGVNRNSVIGLLLLITTLPEYQLC